MAEERKRRMRLGEILVASSVISEAQLEEALAAQFSGHHKRRLGQAIIDLGFCTERDIADALARQLRLETVDLTAIGPTAEALEQVPRKLAERHHVLPLRVDPGEILIVAMSDPTNVVALDDLKLMSGMRAVRPVVATEAGISDALRRAYGSDQAALDMVDAMADPDVVSVEEHDLADADDQGADDQPIIRLANAILADAVRTRASDVHVEPERENVRVRCRIDGLLRETMRVPRHIGPALISRLKIMSNLDIAERRRPQDGRAMIRVEGAEVDLRVSTMPTMYGETIVMRLLRKGSERLSLEDLGMPPEQRERFESSLFRPQGLIVITGPTGSGKTTTLYAGLAELADPVRNVITLEDPIEYQLSGVNQTQVNPKVDLTFSRGLRTVLRQDPDVVMVGEIRDRETAELAMEASFTGHLVLSTLHTNDAPSTIVRLVDLGVERFLIASSLLLVMAQRLARVVCPHCSAPTQPDPRTMKLLGLTPADLEGRELVAGHGCQLCEQTGFRGRLGLYEMLTITPSMRDLITQGGGETQVARLARVQGMRSLREDGLAKAFAGITTLEEVLRVTPEETVEPGSIDPATVQGIAVGGPRPAAEDAADARRDRLVASPALARRARAPDRGFALHFDPATGKASGGTILVVEDDPSVRELLTVILEDHWTVLLAEDGASALQLQDTHRPDVVILDQFLPDMTGIDVTEQIRGDDGRHHVPILMITGATDTETEVAGLLAGVDDYLVKPFDEDVLTARISALLRRKFHV